MRTCARNSISRVPRVAGASEAALSVVTFCIGVAVVCISQTLIDICRNKAHRTQSTKPLVFDFPGNFLHCALSEIMYSSSEAAIGLLKQTSAVSPINSFKTTITGALITSNGVVTGRIRTTIVQTQSALIDICNSATSTKSVNGVAEPEVRGSNTEVANTSGQNLVCVWRWFGANLCKKLHLPCIQGRKYR